MPNVLSPRDLVSRPDILDKTVPHTLHEKTCCQGFHSGPHTNLSLQLQKMARLEILDLGSRWIVLSMQQKQMC